MPQFFAAMQQECPVTHNGDSLGTTLGQQVSELLRQHRGPARELVSASF